ncbi:MAG: VTT domain-containing protein [Nanoarchaeota archaeon]|nr:VTT domain-containing protein [Nanoarchaeota archaeon]
MIDFSNFLWLTLFVQTHGYWIVFLLMLLEGPIVTAAASFAASLGVFNIYVIFVLSFFGDFIGDIVLYYLGRFGRRSLIDRYMLKHHLGKKIVLKVEKLLGENSFKALLLIKVVPPLPVPGLILTGVSKLNVKRFLFASVVINIFYSLAFVLVGYYSGILFKKYLISTWNVEFFIAFIAVLLVLILIYRKYAPRLYQKMSRMRD